MTSQRFVREILTPWIQTERACASKAQKVISMRERKQSITSIDLLLGRRPRPRATCTNVCTDVRAHSCREQRIKLKEKQAPFHRFGILRARSRLRCLNLWFHDVRLLAHMERPRELTSWTACGLEMRRYFAASSGFCCCWNCWCCWLPRMQRSALQVSAGT
jgi:hypothetical protein